MATLTKRPQEERDGHRVILRFSEGENHSEEVAMPIILRLLGVPVTLVLVLWFFGIVSF